MTAPKSQGGPAADRAKGALFVRLDPADRALLMALQRAYGQGFRGGVAPYTYVLRALIQTAAEGLPTAGVDKRGTL